MVTFFALPLVVFMYQVYQRLPDPDELEWLGNVYKVDAALVFGLAGLNSWDRRNGMATAAKEQGKP
jgi:hypothetical protein